MPGPGHRLEIPQLLERDHVDQFILLITVINTMGPDQKPFLVSVATRMALNAGGPPISIRHRTDIGGTGPDQPAAPLLLAGVRRPSRGAGHREDRRKSLPRYGQRIEQDSGEEF